MSDQGAALRDRLCDLTKRWTAHEDVRKSEQAECREIGQKLNDLGGMDLMREAYREAHGRNRAASVIQAYWDGVGDWRW